MPLQLAERQRVFLEDDPHRLQIELGGEVEHGEIFVVERFRHRRFLQLAIGEILVKLAVRFDVALDVHAHEGGELHEARIDAAERAGIAQRHRGGQRALEPFDGMLLGEFVDGGRIDAHVDGPRHQRHAARLRLVAGLRHHGGGGEHGDAGLAHRQHVGARPHHFQKLDQMIDIFVEAEAAGGQRHVTGIMPVGDIDVVVGQHGAHGRPQERREMAGQRRHHEDARLHRRDILLEVQERAERRYVRGLLAHLDFAIADGDAVDGKRRACMGQAGARDQLINRGEIAHRRMVGEQRRAAGIGRVAGPAPDRLHDVSLQLIGEV